VSLPSLLVEGPNNQLNWEYLKNALLASGFGVVVHGTNAAVARPTDYRAIFWIGSVKPENATGDDIWYDTSTALGVARGETSIKFAGGTTISEIKTINHGLGITPVYVNAFLLRSEASTVPFTASLIEGSLNSTSFKLRLFSPTATAETTIKVLWKAEG
jgi:hypothetical protein